jgi:hypothetical protein
MSTDVRSHRAPRTPAEQRLVDAGTRLGVGALVIAALAVGSVIKSYTPDTDTRERPFVRSGALGDQVDARVFDAVVVGVRGAPKVTRSGRTYDTGGVWVLVKVRLVAHAAPTTVSHAMVVDRAGRLYKATQRFSQPLAGGSMLQPDIPAEGEIVFEVPADRAPGLAIQLSAGRLGVRMDALAEISLGIDRATVEGWRAATEAAVVESAGVSS